MSITDELRRWAEDRAFVMGESGFARRIADFCDRIDAEHEALLADARKRAYNAGFDAGFASADDWLAQHEDTMAEHGWVRLPLGEDGEPIRIGELVDERLPFGGYAKPAPVDGMELYRYANGYGWMVKLDAENRALVSPKLLRHHRKPTVEDVLRELLGAWEDTLTSEGVDVIVSEYAAKLRLAGEVG